MMPSAANVQTEAVGLSPEPILQMLQGYRVFAVG